MLSVAMEMGYLYNSIHGDNSIPFLVTEYNGIGDGVNNLSTRGQVRYVVYQPKCPK